MIQPIRPSHPRVPSQPKPRTPKNHRIYVNTTDYQEIKREPFAYKPDDQLHDAMLGDLIIFEKTDYFTGRRTKKIKIFAIASIDKPVDKPVDKLTINLVPFFPDDKSDEKSD